MAAERGGDRAAVVLGELGKKLATAEAVRVGFLQGATYVDGKPVAMIAAIQEYGAPKVGIPPRPFFRNMIAEKKDEWPKAVSDLLKANGYDAKLTLEQTGAAISGQLRESIIKTNSPELSKVTLMLRKYFWTNPQDIRGRDVADARHRVAAGESTAGVSTKPLVWTVHMLNSIDYEVK